MEATRPTSDPLDTASTHLERFVEDGERSNQGPILSELRALDALVLRDLMRSGSAPLAFLAAGILIERRRRARGAGQQRGSN